MHDLRSPQFQTQPPHHDAPPQVDAVWRMRVTDAAFGPNGNLVKAVLINSDDKTPGTVKYTVCSTGGHGVGKTILVTAPLGGAGEVYNNRPVSLIELSDLPPGGIMFQELQKMDQSGTNGWYWTRAHN
jgi:hypothetical protein